MVKEHVDTLGQLPHDWWERWEARHRWFTEEGQRTDGGTSRLLIDRFDDSVKGPRQEYAMDAIGEAEKTAIFAMLKGMLVFEPEERLTAAEFMESEWMLKWALPVLERKEAM
jgi:hypothetical protein